MPGRRLQSGWGYITEADYRFREGSPLCTVASFLTEATHLYVGFNCRYRAEIGVNDFPFFSGEFQNQAIFFKSMSDVIKTNCLAFPEHPYEYKHRQDDAERHRLDYWVWLKARGRKDIVLLVEYEHMSVCLRQRKAHTRKSNYCRMSNIQGCNWLLFKKGS